jgi:hypothetical protein
VATEGERLIWESLSTNKTFLRDLRRFFDVPTELLKAVADRVKMHPVKPLSDADAGELASRFERRTEDIQRIASLMVYLRQRLIDTGRGPMDVIAESRSLLDQEDLAKGREDEIASVLSYSEDEREEVLAIEAFAGGPAFLSTRLRPSLLPVASSGTELAGGYLWTITYLNAEGEQRSITIGLSPGELEQVETAINRAREQFRAIRRVIDSARASES